jgi:hypothetical protein
MMLEFCLLLVVVVLFWPFFVYAAALAVFLGICAACLIAAAVLVVWVWSSGGFVGLASALLAGGAVIFFVYTVRVGARPRLAGTSASGLRNATENRP